MNMKPLDRNLNILHLDGGKGWRGGQRQVFFLIRKQKESHPNLNIVLGSASPELTKLALNEGITTEFVPFHNSICIKSIFRVRKLIKAYKIDAVHCHCAHAHSIMAFVQLFFPGLLTIITRRVDFAIKSHFWNHYKYCRQPTFHFVAISNQIKQILLNFNVPHSQVSLIPSASIRKLAPDKMQYKNKLLSELNLPPTSYLIGNLAHFADHKGHKYLLKAAQIACAKDPHIFIVLAGEGELLEEMKTLAKQLELQNRVFFLGFRRDTEELHAALDIFSITSHLEGLCSSIIDSFLAETPVVASNTGGIPDLVQDRKTGLLTENKNSQHIAESWLKLKSDKELQASLAQNAKVHAENLFSVYKMTCDYEEIYQRALNSNFENQSV